MPTSSARAGRFGIVLGFLAASAGAHPDEKRNEPPPAAGRFRDVLRAPLVGTTPPELRAAEGDWLGGPPTTLAALKGAVVWLQFNF